MATTPGGEVVLVRQLRESVRDRLLEVPAGMLDVEGESPEDAARRELLEEAGYGGGSWSSLGWIYTSPGFADERIELFRAEGVERSGEPEEGMEVVLLPEVDAVAAASDGRIVDAKSVVALLLSRG